jgi:TPP-dependent pyruvate/acetoin dehydrogenase alpha subunit
MILDKHDREKIFERAALCRAFEKEVFNQVKHGNIKLPVYLSAGQEYIPASLSIALEKLGIFLRQIFIQHRGHSTYLCFGGDLDRLILELLGQKSGCAGGMGGSASIQSIEANIYGHDGLMGSHGPIATGMCYSNKLPTLCFTGDAAAEEDYFLASIGWASTKKLPIWFVVEDNNLSILTEKKVRRNWEMSDVASGFKMKSYDVGDDPLEIFTCIPEKNPFENPILFNINTNRLFWHAGAGIDSNQIFDRHAEFSKTLDQNFVNEVTLIATERVSEAWNRHLKN